MTAASVLHCCFDYSLQCDMCLSVDTESGTQQYQKLYSNREDALLALVLACRPGPPSQLCPSAATSHCLPQLHGIATRDQGFIIRDQPMLLQRMLALWQFN